ncbi:3-hydroxy-3-methylglutaryl-coenzyme A reductase 3-like [Cynara cardunculus var. scolymus]|uniref:3-hydroxy-3-methylglutaryl-coenzyme A reductase 3-like n=1 Tax=Cynara cardunculus var. scolymus TaxID=59895 RepID=UPI000D62FE54|nr:3-hydroxy-3-methylglutaryl-coenzyme A reductase 3-like [Cynara cardunculus var. scolymus]
MSNVAFHIAKRVVQKERVRTLCRRTLRNARGRALHRHLVYSNVDVVHERFHANKHTDDVDTNGRMIVDGKAKYGKWQHNDRYVVLRAHDGSKFTRNPTPSSRAIFTSFMSTVSVFKENINATLDRKSGVPIKQVEKKDEEIAPMEEDEAVIQSVISGKTPSYSLESKLGDCKRAAFIRRVSLERVTGKSLDGLPLDGLDYESILGQCCEMPVGYIQIPVGIVGPMLLDGEEFWVPMATTEGCLVASTNRGCKATYTSGGATSILLKDGMTRAPVVRFGTARRAADLKFFLEEPRNFETLASVFNKSSRFGRLQNIRSSIAGKNLYIRFTCSTGDAMGMNMVSKGVQNVLDHLKADFPDMDVIGISGNYCSDKKPAAVNWIEGRGKSVVCEAIINEEIVKNVLKTDIASLVELNMLKNLAGSAMAGALGGFNAHASNIVSAVYLATGQDPAQNIESSHCITMMEAVNDGKDLHASVTMPSIEVGTVGGGTQLASQAACLNLLGVKGANKESAGSNARRLAKVVAAAVLAGELSLMAALTAGQLVKSHMKYNRYSKDVTAAKS